MRASLVSATSLLALLLLDEAAAYATPSVSVASSSINFGYQVVGTTSTARSDTITASTIGASNTTLSVSAASSPFGPTSKQTSVIATNTAGTLAASFTFGPLTTGAASTTVTASDSAGGNAPLITLTGTGVAPIATVTASPVTGASTLNGYVLVGTSASSTVTVSNTGNGNLAAGSAGNLVGTIGSTSSVFVGTASSFQLNDSNYSASLNGTSYGTSRTNTYTFTPTAVGAASTVVTTTLANGTNASNAAGTVLTTLTATGVAPIQSVSGAGATSLARVGTSVVSTLTISNIGNGNKASTVAGVGNLTGSVTTVLGSRQVAGPSTGTINLTDGATTTLSYTYTPISRGTVSSTATLAFSNGNAAGTNTSQTVSSVFVDQGVGPVYASSITGAGTTNTPTSVSNGSIGAASSTISLGSVGYQKSATVYLNLQNTTTDPGAASLTNLTIESYSIAGANAGAFSISLASGSIITEGGQLLVPITVTDNTPGVFALNSSLTIFTDESAALGGVGDTFTYSLTAMAVPEPASLAVFGAGLAGLSSMRRRRRA